MDTAHKTEEEKLEFFDSPDELSIKVDKFISLLKKSTHFIAFTGAGVSTSAGVPDFRSGYNTVLPTGPGAWEKKALKQQVKKKIVSVGMHEAIPTKTHMSLVELERKGLLKYLVSQNVDGLHRRSGFLPEKLAELHGNTNLEFCKKCGKQYLRDFRCRNSQNSVHEHKTIRKCDNSSCKGDLYDSIVNFGENLPEREINESFEHAEKADLCLAMGSSLRVTPAANIPQIVGKKNDLVIVNIQKTPLDKHASLRIYSMCDQFMELVMKKLEFEIPEFTLTRRISVKIDKNEDKQFVIVSCCLDEKILKYWIVNKKEGKNEYGIVSEKYEDYGIVSGLDRKNKIQLVGTIPTLLLLDEIKGQIVILETNLK